MITDEMITEAIKNANKDQYGQTPIFNKTISNLFPNIDRNIVVDYLNHSKKYRLSTYGSKYEIFQAIELR